VAIGNSITAGIQSGGINEKTQRESYAALLAEQMGTPFNIPVLPDPGCPPPLAQAFPPVSIAPDVNCALRAPSTSSPLNNVAVPSAEVIDVLNNRAPASNPNQLTSFILGGQTQIETTTRANPTFVTAWIGNNDVLGAAIAGDTTLATSVDSFRTRYARMVSQLQNIDTLQGAVFLKVADVTLIPHFSTGAAYNQAIPAAQGTGALPSNFALESCTPGESGDVSIPYQHGAALLGAAAGLKEQLGDFAPTITLDCAQDRTVETTIRESIPGTNGAVEQAVLSQIGEDVQRISLLTPDEKDVLKTRFEAFNRVIEDEVPDEYAIVNPNPLFEANRDRIPDFPNLFDDAPPFGPFFSLDGIHPSSQAHRLVTNAVIEEIQSTYDVTLSTLPAQ
jgi:lysophospholipase L1-like esterase